MIDVPRGFALLGILLMNILSFSMPGVAEANPNAMPSVQVSAPESNLVPILLFVGVLVIALKK